ncbi:hypothetical protein [Telmatospirillum siberiense]|nr:hypothetical protein [Telmatospirillum siberiense]
MIPSHSPPQRARLLLFFVVPPCFGLAALYLGMDANWDLRNYHYYNAWALLTDRYDRDIATAQIPTFYNPIIDVPYFLLAQWLPARLLAFLLGCLHGINFILLHCLAERVLIIRGSWRRLSICGAVALAGTCGAVALSEIGTVFYDNLLSFGFFGSLALALRHWKRLEGGDWKQACLSAALVGLPAGLAFGLKQTSVIYTFGVCGGLLFCLPVSPWRRLLAAFFCGLGILGGLALGGGYWMWHLWHLYGNPLFPMFNQFFRSPWGLVDSYRDVQYLLGSAWRRVYFPVLFSLDSRQAGEIHFRDYRVLSVFLLIPLAGITAWRDAARRKMPSPPAPFERRQAAYLLTATAISYVVWVQLFGVYRYIIAIEMLAPLLAVLAVGYLTPLGRFRRPLTIGLLALLVVSTRPGTWIRVPFEDQAVAVEVPAIPDPANTIVLLAGHEPLSFLLPAFPPEIRFLRIDSTFTNPDQTTVRFNQEMHRIVEHHRGRLSALFIPTERHDVINRLGDYGLFIPDGLCATVTSPIGAAPYDLCPVERK